jgi:paraquat-inducible protein B
LTGEELPRARVRRRRLPNVAWLVPLVALLVAGYLVWDRLRERGPEIVISFDDGAGVRVGVTPVKYRGVDVGEVIGVGLSKAHDKALVRVRLQRSAASLARQGTRFWIVRPQVGFGSITGLNTVLTGPVIQALPANGGGAPQRQFTGLDSAPVGSEADGLQLVLRAERPRSIRPNTPVNYRGVPVGLVQKVDLSPNATSADVHVLIYERYAALVREGSTFWDTSGVSVKGGLLKGIEVDIESLRAIATGGIEFATPSAKAARVKPGTVFFLYDAPKDEWLSWLPRIALPADK